MPFDRVRLISTAWLAWRTEPIRGWLCAPFAAALIDDHKQCVRDPEKVPRALPAKLSAKSSHG